MGYPHFPRVYLYFCLICAKYMALTHAKHGGVRWIETSRWAWLVEMSAARRMAVFVSGFRAVGCLLLCSCDSNCLLGRFGAAPFDSQAKSITGAVIEMTSQSPCGGRRDDFSGLVRGLDSRTLPSEGSGLRLEMLRVYPEIRHCWQGLDELFSYRVQTRVLKQPSRR